MDPTEIDGMRLQRPVSPTLVPGTVFLRSTQCLTRLRFWTYPLSFSTISRLQPSLHGFKNEKKVDIEHLFKLCVSPQVLKRVHALLVVSGPAQSVYVSTRLINLYAHLRDLQFARKAFDAIPSKDAYTWNSIIAAYVRIGCCQEALKFFNELVLASQVPPDNYTFPPVLKACEDVIDGCKIHCWVFKLGYLWDVFVAASLLHMYSRFGFVADAQKIFENMPFRDPASWNAMISGFCLNRNPEKALDLVGKMHLSHICMDPVTVSSILPIYAQVGDFLGGVLIHLYAIKHGLENEVYVSNALINMYAKFGYLQLAQKIFDKMLSRDLISWNSIIAAYEQNDDPESAIRLFRKMQCYGFLPDVLSLVSLASSVAQLGDCKNGKMLHGFVIKGACLMDNIIMGNAVVDMYAKLGIVDYAWKVFQEMPMKDIISWNTLITGYSQNGFAVEALDAFRALEAYMEVSPNQGTWVSVLPAYSHLGALYQGTKIHGHIIKSPLYLDIFVGTCLVDMYGKCGRLDSALRLFYEIPRTNSVPWNAIISCHGIHGHGEISLKLFEEMLLEGVDPDHVTFLSLLSACSHSGLVDEGQWCFHVMQDTYGIRPSLKHYGCMVDSLGRAGLLEKAYEFIKGMTMQPDASIWGALLAACRVHKNFELAKLASEQLFALDSDNVGYFVLMSNIYANAGKWEGVNEMRYLAWMRGLKKTPAWSSIEVNNKVDVFCTGNKSHPKCDQIYKELHILTDEVKNLGYSPDFNFVLQDVEEDEKEHILYSHGERLAITFGLISTPPKSTIRIFKNLRVCGDCHNWTKFISKITERNIIVRDSNRFHHFKGGNCSCRDFW